MAKGQMRSNKEKKKPKQNKERSTPASSPFAAQQRPSNAPAGKKR
jgi:hypothetical protein